MPVEPGGSSPPLSILALNKVWASVCVGRKRTVLNNESFFLSANLRFVFFVFFWDCKLMTMFGAEGVVQWTSSGNPAGKINFNGKRCEQIFFRNGFHFYFLGLIFQLQPGGYTELVLPGASGSFPHLLLAHCYKKNNNPQNPPRNTFTTKIGSRINTTKSLSHWSEM